MNVQYKQVVIWDLTLVDVGFLGSEQSVFPEALRGLAVNGCKITTGAPVATVGVWAPGATVTNLIDSTMYINEGTTAAPVWTLFSTTTSGFSLPLSETDAATTTGTSFALIMSALTTGVGQKITASAVTTGTLHQMIAAAATLTTGRYYAANDGALNVWSVGANGHQHFLQTTAPTIAVSTANGISAAAITAGGTDVVGIITTTGTNNAGGDTVLQVTFNKTYTTAPKAVFLTPRNASAAKAAATSLALPYISAIAATTFDITIPSDASAGATPSFNYLVIA